MSAAQISSENFLADIVTVPDFAGKRAFDFEVRTLFLLASWHLKTREAKQNCALHIACIGEAPPRVRELAGEVGAQIHVFEPLRIGHSVNVNKMRGFEIASEKRRSSRIFLLDSDITFVSDPCPPLREIAPNAISAGVANVKWISEALWERIYRATGVTFSGERRPILKVELGLHSDDFVVGKGAHRTDLRAHRPYWNGGIVTAPWDANLGELWASHLEKIYAEFAPPRNRWEKAQFFFTDRARMRPKGVISTSDQAGLATAIEFLRAQNHAFQILPDALHTRHVHFRAGKLRFREAAIWHMTGFAKGLNGREDVPAHLEEYGSKTDQILAQGAQRRGETARELSECREFLREIWAFLNS